MNQAEKDSRRSYQDTPHPDFRKHVGIWADLERLRPRGDCVVVRLIPEPEQHANLIWIPDVVRKGENSLPRIGEVVAVGLGDRLFTWFCKCCIGGQRSTFHAPEPCPICGQNDFGPAEIDFITRHPMHVKPGDRVVFWRVLANQMIINEEIFQFVREESQILAVLEEEESNGTRN